MKANTPRDEGRQASELSPFLCRASASPESRDGVRVLHIAQTVAGGIASFFEEIACHQSRVFGAENVKFLMPSAGASQLPRIAPEQLFMTSSSSRRLRPLVEFTRASLNAIENFRPEVVHLHSSFAGALRMFLHEHPSRAKIIYCPHGWAFGMELPGAQRRAYAAVERRLSAMTNMIIVNSNSEYELAIEFGLPPGKLRIVRNGVSWMPLRRRPKISKVLSIAFIGRHDRQKGLDILLDTIVRFPLQHLDFHVVGEAVCQQRRANDAHLGSSLSNVTFHGWLDREATLDFLARVDAVVMPSRWEAFGLVAIEAMRAGVPVIASNRGALPEVVQDSVGGHIFDLDDRDALGRLLSHLDRDQLKRLGVSARERWEQNFLGERMNLETEQIYRELVPKPVFGNAVAPETLAAAVETAR